MSEIVKTESVLGGKPRIDGRRIGVHQIVSLVVDGDLAPEEMAVRYDLELADIHRAIAYYYDNPEEIRAVQKRRREKIENADPARPEDLGIGFLSDDARSTCMVEIVETPNVLGGKPRIDGRRIGVHHIVTDVFEGNMSPERIAAEYDIDVADVYRAIAYYYDNPEEIRTIRERARECMEESERAIRPEDVGLTQERERPEPDA